MPKMSQDWTNYQKRSGVGDRSKAKNNNMKTEDVFLRLKEGDTIRGRLIGYPIDFIAHWPRIDEGERDGNNNIAWKNSPFPDEKERNFKPTRICTDDTPARERYQDIDGYLERTKCPWCKLKFQGYHGNLRHAFNIITRPDNACKVLEVPPTVMGELSQICRDAVALMPNGPGDVSGKVFEFVFSRVQDNKWSIQRYPNLDITDDNISSYLVELTDEDKRALKVINPDANTEEDLLRGHDLERWYRKDYLSAKWQTKLASKLGLKPGEYLELSPYEKSHGVGDVVEEFEAEVDEMNEMEDIQEVEENNDAKSEDEWGSLDEEDSSGEVSDSSDEDDSPLW